MEKIRQRLSAYLGSQQFTWPALRSMFLTLTLDQFFIIFINMLSTALVSSVGEAAIAAVSMAGTVNGMVSLIFTSVSSGGAIIAARAKGRGDREEIRQTIGTVTGLSFLVAAVLGSLLFTLSPMLIQGLYPSVEPQLSAYASQYIRLIALSFLPFSIFNAIFNLFRCLGDTRSSLFLTIVINVTHLLLSLLFINGLKLGVLGSGLSYIAARTVGMVLALVWLLAVHRDYGVRPRHFVRFPRQVIREVAEMGAPMTLESLLMQGGMLLVNIYLARLATTEMAAHAVANSIFNLFAIPGNALLALTGTVCGQCYGAADYGLTRQYSRRLVSSGCVLLLFTSLVLWPLLPLLLRLYGATPAGEVLIRQALFIGVAALPFLWCGSYLPAMSLRVAGDGVFTSAVSVLALMLCRCVLGYVLTIPLGLGIRGVWFALITEWLLRALAFRLRMRGDRWLHIKTA